MIPVDAAFRYAGRGWPVFPCCWYGAFRKRPLLPKWPTLASSDFDAVTEWWQRWPAALIGMPTGERSGVVVLDVDVKNGAAGFATLDEIDSPIRPATPTVHTASGGAHFYFARPAGGLRNTAGQHGRGIGPGLDWRGDGGFVILPSQGSGYHWGDRHFGNCGTAAVPPHLMPQTRPAVERPRPATPRPRGGGLMPYAQGALDSAAHKIINAPRGEQEITLNAEAFSIGTLASAGAVAAPAALKVLLWAARQLHSCDPNRPWLLDEVEKKTTRAFNDGLHHPREDRYAT